MITTTISPSPADLYRPRFHFTPKSTWMNDPNGLIRYDGRWHLFFQNNPFGSTWGNLSWGHAVSDDLATWEELPVAIPCAPDEMIFSGSAVHDAQNVSGLGAEGEPGPLLAFYTSAYSPTHPTRPGLQAQSLAYSVDGGLTWTRYAGNPILDRGSQNFRDPKVFFHPESQRWVMITVEALDYSVLIHTSADLLTWEHASTFTDPSVDGGIWECPDLVRVPVVNAAGDCEVDAAGDSEAWVLVLSTNPGGPAGGSGTYYLVGEFDGRTFTATREARPFDLGPDSYASVSFSGVSGEPILVGWMSNWDYATETPTAPWRSTMTLPRRLRLEARDGGLRLLQELVTPQQLPSHHVEVSAAARTLAVLPGDEPFRLHGPLDMRAPAALRVRFGDEQDGCELTIELDDQRRIWMDRSHANTGTFAPSHTRSLAYQADAGPDAIDLELVIDRSTAELLLDGGRAATSMLFFPSAHPITVLSAPR